MRTRLVFGVLLVLGGCVPSLQPLYTDKDLVFDPALIGKWVPNDDTKGTWEFAKKGPREYNLVVTDPAGLSSGFSVHMLKIGDRSFLDIFPTDGEMKANDYFKMHLLPAHTFMLVDVGPTLQMTFFDPEWLKNHLKDHPDAIRHEWVDGRIVLSAQPKELQAFVIEHEKEAFGKPMNFVHEAKPESSKK